MDEWTCGRVEIPETHLKQILMVLHAFSRKFFNSPYQSTTRPHHDRQQREMACMGGGGVKNRDTLTLAFWLPPGGRSCGARAYGTCYAGVCAVVTWYFVCTLFPYYPYEHDNMCTFIFHRSSSAGRCCSAHESSGLASGRVRGERSSGCRLAPAISFPLLIVIPKKPRRDGDVHSEFRRHEF